jgi:ABC-type Fe3+/spermidine/putrescine transport system ATPase subunit
MSDKIAVMNKRVVLTKSAQPKTFIMTPANAFVAGFVGELEPV